MILSGLRIFDIRDVAHPKEVGYFNRPIAQGENPLVTASQGAFAMSQPAWDVPRTTRSGTPTATPASTTCDSPTASAGCCAAD